MVLSRECLLTAQVSPDSVVLAAETVGLAGLAGSVSRALAEDVSYRLREVASTAATLLRHSRKATTNIIDWSMFVYFYMGFNSAIGHCACNQTIFISRIVVCINRIVNELGY